MAKILYSRCYGGFSISPACLTEYAHRKGWSLIIVEGDHPWDTVYYRDEVSDDNYISLHHDFDRADPVLIGVVEDLGLEICSGSYAQLAICEVPTGRLYRIHEYDGFESVILSGEERWETAS